MYSVLTHFILSFSGVKVFREPRKANQLDQVLSSYSSCIKVGTATLIFERDKTVIWHVSYMYEWMFICHKIKLPGQSIIWVN